MASAARRLITLRKHLTSAAYTTTVPKPQIMVTPSPSMADEKVHIQLCGLQADKMVRLQASVEQNGTLFQSHAMFKANSDGMVDVMVDESLDGTYTGKDAMGLFWSLKATEGQVRFVKKDVTTPTVYTLKLFENALDVVKSTEDVPVTETALEMWYMKKGMKRIPMNEGRFKGTIFIPEGKGPFPGIIDMYGGLVSIVENRAALLATHGYATYALTYLYTDHLTDDIKDIDLRYVTDAVQWFLERPFVDRERIGTVGLCMGGSLALHLASYMPEVRAVVNINGTPISPAVPDSVDDSLPHRDKFGNPWPQSHRIFSTDEGFVVRDIWEGPDMKPVPAWKHGAKILTLIGEDDKQVHPKFHTYFRDNSPQHFQQNIELVSYPGAGHLIEPRYSPLCKEYSAHPKRIDGIYFIPSKYREDVMLAGGIPKLHAHAQEDGWERLLAFLDRELRS